MLYISGWINLLSLLVFEMIRWTEKEAQRRRGEVKESEQINWMNLVILTDIVFMKWSGKRDGRFSVGWFVNE